MRRKIRKYMTPLWNSFVKNEPSFSLGLIAGIAVAATSKASSIGALLGWLSLTIAAAVLAGFVQGWGEL